MSFFKKVLGKEKEEPPPFGSSVENVNIAPPGQAHHKPHTKGDALPPPSPRLSITPASPRPSGQFERQGSELGLPSWAVKLEHMTVELTVWRLGHYATEEKYEVTLSRFLKPRYEIMSSFAHAYDFSAFRAVFEGMINEAAQDAKPPRYPTEVDYGKLTYERKGDIIEVKAQNEFENAISQLFQLRGDNLFLFLLLQLESREAATSRLAASEQPDYLEGAVDDILSMYGVDEKVPRVSEDQVEEPPQEFAPMEQIGEIPPFAGKAGEPAHRIPPSEAIFKDTELRKRWSDSESIGYIGLAKATSPKDLSPYRRPVSQGRIHRINNHNAIQRAFDRAGNIIAGRPPNRERENTPLPSPTDERPSSSLGDAIKKQVEKVVAVAKPGKKQQESKEQERKRFLELFTEEDRTTFKKGGEVEEEEINIEKLEAIDREATAEEADLPEEKEEDEKDEDISQEDRVATKLQNLLNLKELTQLKGPTLEEGLYTPWEECCRMFRRDPNDTKIDQPVYILGLRTQIYQYQAFGIYWQMVSSRELGGGFVADEMGLGKTLSFLAYMTVERQLSVLWSEVLQSRAKKDVKYRHLYLEEQTETAECPRQPRLGPGWIECPCTKRSPARYMLPQRGLRMACVPSQLVGSWWAQWKTHVDTVNPILGMTIVVDHKVLFGAEATIEDRKASSDAGRNKEKMRARLYELTPGSKKGTRGDDVTVNQEGWLLLTTKESFPKLAQSFALKGEQYVRDPKNRDEWIKGTRIPLIFGIAMIDESHEEYFKNTGRAKILSDLPTGNTELIPHIWGYSGTPFSQTPRGLEGVLWAIEKHSKRTEAGKTGWQTNKKFKEFEYHQLDKICKLYDQELKGKERNDATVDLILKRFKPFVANFILRRTASTMWFGHTLIKLKPHIHQDVRLKRQSKTFADKIPEFEDQFQHEKDEILAKLQEKWDNFPDQRRSDVRPTKLAFNTMCRTHWRSRLLSTFPFLWKLATTAQDDHKLSLDDAEVLGFRGSDQKERTSPYSKNLKNIVEYSPKCLWLYNFINQLEAQRDIDGNEEKVIILTDFPQVAFILKLLIQRYFPDKKGRVGVVAGRMKLSEKSEIIDAFKDAVDTKGKRKTKKDIQFLVGSIKNLGVGLQLTRACNVILMEPDYDFARQAQAYSRVHRIGQRNPRSRSYRLIDAGSDVEEKILKRQRDRNEYFGKLMSIEEMERAQIEFGKPANSHGLEAS